MASAKALEINQMIETAESNLISTTPGAVPPHMDDGGHLPFGGTTGNTRGPSAFGKRKMTRANAIGNPQALLLNYPPENTEATLKGWERNYKSSIYEDPAADGAFRLTSSNHVAFGKAALPSDLAANQQTWGNLRQTAFTRPSPCPTFVPPDRNATAAQLSSADYNWKWPTMEKRSAAPQIKRPEKVEQSFLQEYELRPPWLKY